MSKFSHALKSRAKALLLNKFRLQVRRLPKRGDQVFPGWVDPEFVSLYRKYHETTMVSWQGLYWSWCASNYIQAHGVLGDVVECGVFKGGCSLLMAECHVRTTWMYDTFTGMAEPGEHDYKGSFKGERFDAVKRHSAASKDGYVDWVYESLDNVKRNVLESGLGIERFRFIKGKVEETIPEHAPEQIALLRLDTDFYSSTKHELEHLYPRLSIGGVLIIDDFGSWAGSRKAVQEYFAQLDVAPLAFPESNSGSLLAIKTRSSAG